MTAPTLLTIKETGDALRVSRRTVYRLIAEGRLRVVHVRGRSLVTVRELEAYIAAQVRAA